MRKYIAALGLAGLVGIWYYASRHSTTESSSLRGGIGLAEDKVESPTYSAQRKTYAPAPSPQSYFTENDNYRDYVNSRPLISKVVQEGPERPELPGCDEQEILREHEEISRLVPHLDTDCSLTWNVGTLIRLDRQLAHCKYKNNHEKFEEIMREIAEHLESKNSNLAAGEILYHFGETERARELFLQDHRATELLLKITPLEELPALADYYLRHDNPFDAGKVEWFQGNRELGRTLIEQSEYYQETMGEVKMRLSHGSYKGPVYTMWELKLPFHWEMVWKLCGGNKECLRIFEKDRPF